MPQCRAQRTNYFVQTQLVLDTTIEHLKANFTDNVYRTNRKG